MNDFERAAALLKQRKHTGKRVSTTVPESDNNVIVTGSSLESLKSLLQKKVNEPLDLLLQDDADPSPRPQSKYVGETSTSKALPASRIIHDSVDTKELDTGELDTKELNTEELDTEELVNFERRPTSDGHGSGSSVSTQMNEASILNRLELSFSSLAARGYITPGISKSQLTEEYRRIKRPLLKHMIDAESASQLNVIMVTSSIQGEGKTYSAVNLAVSLAQEKNRSVLLIDADVIKGTAGRELGARGDEPGLLDLLTETYVNISEVLLSTNIPGLTFMPAGKADENANELLTSPRMRDMVSLLATESAERIIVLDCPPILQTNEANVLADYAGQIVFVVAEQHTSQALVQEALKHLDKNKFVGMLLNKSSRVGAGYGYGNGYGYGYQ